MAQNDTISSIGDFIQRLVEEKGLEALDPEILTQVKSDLTTRAENRINAAILAEMPEGKIDAFKDLLDTGTGEEVQKFCQQAIPHLDALVASELMKFREVYLAAA